MYNINVFIYRFDIINGCKKNTGIKVLLSRAVQIPVIYYLKKKSSFSVIIIRMSSSESIFRKKQICLNKNV